MLPFLSTNEPALLDLDFWALLAASFKNLSGELRMASNYLEERKSHSD